MSCQVRVSQKQITESKSCTIFNLFLFLFYCVCLVTQYGEYLRRDFIKGLTLIKPALVGCAIVNKKRCICTLTYYTKMNPYYSYHKHCHLCSGDFIWNQRLVAASKMGTVSLSRHQSARLFFLWWHKMVEAQTLTDWVSLLYGWKLESA